MELFWARIWWMRPAMNFPSPMNGWGERKGKGVIGGNRGEGPPVFNHERASFRLKSTVGSRHGGVVRKRREDRQEE